MYKTAPYVIVSLIDFVARSSILFIVHEGNQCNCWQC